MDSDSKTFQEEDSIRQRSLDNVDDDKQGLALGQGGRIQLMAKLAQGWLSVAVEFFG